MSFKARTRHLPGEPHRNLKLPRLKGALKNKIFEDPTEVRSPGGHSVSGEGGGEERNSAAENGQRKQLSCLRFPQNQAHTHIVNQACCAGHADVRSLRRYAHMVGLQPAHALRCPAHARWKGEAEDCRQPQLHDRHVQDQPREPFDEEAESWQKARRELVSCSLAQAVFVRVAVAKCMFFL